MMSSQLMAEDEIAVASAASVLLKRGHGSQLGRMSLLFSWLILSRVNDIYAVSKCFSASALVFTGSQQMTVAENLGPDERE